VSDKAGRQALKRMQDVNVGVVAPLAALQANPLPNSVALVSLADFAAAKGKVPPYLHPSCERGDPTTLVQVHELPVCIQSEPRRC
jgi:hypothetical protein